MYYIYDVNNLKIPYFLDSKPAMFEDSRKAQMMCHIMNSVMPDRTFIITCKRGLFVGARVKVTDSYGQYTATITAIQVDHDNHSLFYKAEYDNGGYDWLCDFELEVVYEEE